MFSISATPVVVSASSANKVKDSVSVVLSLFSFFLLSLPLSALRAKVCGCGVSLSLSRIDFSQQGNPRWQKYGSSSRDLSHVPFTSLFSRASLRDGDSGGFLLFSFILFSRNEAACDDILPPRLPLLPGRRRAKDRFGVSGKKYSHSSLSLSLSLFIFIIIHRTTNTKQNTAKKVVSKNNNNAVAKNAALLAATIATISSSGAALADDIEDVYAATYAKGRDGFGVRSPQRQAVDVNLARKQAAPKPKFVKPVREEAPKPAKKESSGGGFSLPSISLPSISLPSFGGDAPATADE